jgi:hypothetical protein
VQRFPWVIARRQSKDVRPQRFGDRDSKRLAGLTSCQPDCVSLKINVRPSKRRNVTEPLPGIKSKPDQTAPVVICAFQDSLQLVQRKTSTHPFASLTPHGVNKLRRISLKYPPSFAARKRVCTSFRSKLTILGETCFTRSLRNP